MRYSLRVKSKTTDLENQPGFSAQNESLTFVRFTNSRHWSVCHTQMDDQWDVWVAGAAVSHSLSLCSSALPALLQTLSLSAAALSTICSCPWLLNCTGSEGGQKGITAGELFVCVCCQNKQRKDDLWIAALLRLHWFRGRRIRRLGTSALCDGWWGGRLYLWPHASVISKINWFSPSQKKIWGCKTWIY